MNPARERVAAAVAAAVLAVALLTGPARGASTPPPTPVPPRGSPSPFVSELERFPAGRPVIEAPEALLADLDSGQAMFARAPGVPRPIASLTKVMTAIVVIERTDPDDIVVVPPAAVFEPGDYGEGSSLGLRAGERVSVEDLLYGLMLQSSNDAAEALAIHVAGSVEGFVGLMDRRAERLGMRDTSFASPHGLDDRGISTARDLLILTRAAYGTAGLPRIMRTKQRTVSSSEGPDRRIQNRNVLLWLYPGTTGVKTGLTFGAGYCVIAVTEREDRRLVSIVLGDEDEPFSEAAALLEFGFTAFEEATFVEEGAAAGDLAVRGGTVPVVAARAITALVPATQIADVRVRLVADPKAAYPPTVGERVGSMVVSLPGVTLGSSPLLAAQVELPPQPDPGAWWWRAAGAVAGAVVEVAAGLAS